MFFNSKFVRAALTLSIVFCVIVAVFADTIRLKDGSVIKGKVVGFNDGKFLIVIGDGNRQRQISYYADEVERIEFDSNPSMPNNSVRIGNSDSSPKPSPTVVISNNSGSNNSGNSNRPINSNNVIIVGGNRNTNSNQNNSNQVATNTNSKPNNSNNSSNNTNEPISLKVKVLADNTANGWTNSLFVVKRGQKIRISASGRVSLGNGRFSTPSGVSSLPDSEKLIKNEPTGGLVAVIGDDNNDFIFVGNGREFTAQRDGFLFLGLNESEAGLSDNSGAYDVTIEVQ